MPSRQTTSSNSYSYASEHLDDDAAIASLLSCAVALRAATACADVDIVGALKWIDTEIARLWTARGMYPGLGSALTAFGLDHGALLAHEIVRAGAREGEVFDAFGFIDTFVNNPDRFPQAEPLGFGASFREKWSRLPAERRQLLALVARCNLKPDQALRIYQPSFRTLSPVTSDTDILGNPYLMFERDVTAADRISFGVVDRGVFPADAVREAAPLPPPTTMSDAIDRRRVRALMIDLLEHAVVKSGHTLLPRSWIVQRALNAPLDPKCAIDQDVIDINTTWITTALAETKTGSGELAFKLQRYATTREAIRTAIRKRVAAKQHALVHPWRQLVDEALGQGLPEHPDDRKEEERARREKPMALELIAQWACRMSTSSR